MTVHDYLSQYADAILTAMETRRIIADLDTLKTCISTSTPPNAAGYRHKTGGVQYGYADIIADIDAKKRDLHLQVITCLATLECIRTTIEILSDDRYRHLLTLRYINRLTWEQIAHYLDKDTRYIYKLRNKAFDALCVAFPGKFDRGDNHA